MTNDAERGTRERPSRMHGGRLSEILSTIANDESRERVSVGDLVDALGDRTFGALLLIFSFPNVFPTPPGTSAITGAPLVFLSAQLMMGQAPWLPGIIASRSMARTDFAAVVVRITPWLARSERMLKPRAGVLVYPPAEYLIGLLCLVMAIILTLPIPLGNILPALAMCFFGFGLLERDGIAVLIGVLLFVFAFVIVAGVVFAMVKGVLLLLTMPIG